MYSEEYPAALSGLGLRNSFGAAGRGKRKFFRWRKIILVLKDIFLYNIVTYFTQKCHKIHTHILHQGYGQI